MPVLGLTSLEVFAPLRLRDIILRSGRQPYDKRTHCGTEGRGSRTEREKIKYYRES